VSGLRNPPAAVRGVGAGALAVEAVVLLLAIQPLRVLGARLTGVGVAVMVGLAVAAVLIAGLLKRGWAWHAGTVLQVLVVLAGFFHLAVGVIGLIFAGVWWYVLHVRRTVLSGPGDGSAGPPEGPGGPTGDPAGGSDGVVA